MLSSGSATIGRDEIKLALRSFGITKSEEGFETFWSSNWLDLYGKRSGSAASVELNARQSYELLRRAGASGKRILEAIRGGSRNSIYHKVYLNQIRMGGRDPGEVAHAVTVEDALTAVGVGTAREDAAAIAFFRRFERQYDIVLPQALKMIVCKTGAADAVLDCHPNHPAVLPLVDGAWKLLTPPQRGIHGTHGLAFMTPRQGDFMWVAAFDNAAVDARVYVVADDYFETSDLGSVNADPRPWVLTAPTLSLFFWDLAQMGLERSHRESQFTQEQNGARHARTRDTI